MSATDSDTEAPVKSAIDKIADSIEALLNIVRIQNNQIHHLEKLVGEQNVRILALERGEKSDDG